jgi:DNA-binding winged helix-turn-helix (wHTH) protein
LSFCFVEFEVYVARHELRRAREVVHIEPQAFNVIGIVSKAELIEAVWQGAM